MLGSIIGDIVGSIYEFHNIKTKEFPFFSERCGYTDDSILTIATAKWILEGGSQNTVPQAIVAFFEGVDFEDSIRNAISIGGDSDTLGCITGSIAEAFYGIPKDLYDKGLEYLTPHFKNVVKEFEEKYGNKVV